MGFGSNLIATYRRLLMLRTALLLAVSLAMGSSAFAAERAPADHVPICMPMAKFKDGADAKTKFTQATIGQFHVLEGFYIMAPHTPEGLPPGDGALIVSIPPPHGHPAVSIIAWTQHGGKEVCGATNQIISIPTAVLALLSRIETGKDEKSEPADDPKDELRL